MTAMLADVIALTPDAGAICRHLTAAHGDAPGGTLFEIRAIAEGRPVRARLFDATMEGFAEATALARSWNTGGFNVYTGVNLRRRGTSRDCAARASDVVPEAQWCVVDFDDAPDAQHRLRALSISPRFVVHTGTVPHWRGQAWWRLDTPISLAPWSALQRDLAILLGADPSLTDAARVVRVSGTVSWPKATKIARGYIAEVTRAEKWPGSPRDIRAAALRAMIGGTPVVECEPPTDDDWTADVESRPSLPAPSLARIRSALAFIDPAPRDSWLRVGAALKAHAAVTGEEIEDIFVAWSRGDLRHDGARTPPTFRGAEDCTAFLATLRRDGGAA